MTMAMEWAEPTGHAGLSRLVRAMTALALAALLASSWTAAATAQNLAPDEKSCRQDVGDAAIAACTRIIQRRDKVTLENGLAGIYVIRGINYRVKDDPDRAIADFSAALRIDPKYAYAYTLRGFAYWAKRDLDRAIADFSEAIRIDPKYAWAYTDRGDAYRAKGDLPSALKDFETALRIDPDYRTAQESLAEVKAEIERAGGPTPAPAPPVAVAVAPARPPLAAETRVALVIGNSSYSSVPRLENPRRDAKAIAAALRSSGFTKVIEAADLTREQLFAAVRAFATDADKADWAMVYFAGHGLEIGGVNYLIPVDAKLLSDRDVQFEALPLNTLLSALEGARKLRLVVLDACRNNPFASQMKMASAGRSVGRGLGRVEPDAGTLVVYAARDGQIAQDGDGANSPFAAALISRLKVPNIDIRRMFDQVADDVMASTGKKQEPYTYGRLSGQEDYFFTAPK